MKKTVSDEKRFIAIATVILVVISIVALFPMILLVVASFTDENELITNGYQILPKKLSLEAYTYMVKQAATIVRSYLVTIGTTVVGTGLSVLLTTSIAYPMARKTFKYRNALSFFVYFTMLFNGGLVPQYIMWTTFFHIKDTYAALIFPNLLMTAFNIFLVRNYYSNSLPEALYEAAQLDGASEAWNFHQNCISAVEAGSCHHWTVYRSFLLEQLDQCFILRTGSKIFWYSESADAYHEKH